MRRLFALACLALFSFATPAQSHLYTFDGEGSSTDGFGVSVSGAGDVNADGYSDLIVGHPLEPDNGVYIGSAQVFSGKDGTILFTFYGDAACDVFGYSVSGAGDVNADGYADLIAGAHFDDQRAISPGYARVFSGKDGSILYTFNGDSAFDSFGRSVSDTGDVNGDGYADFIVGADLDDNKGISSGSARVFSGKDGVILYTFDGDSALDSFGFSVSGAGDVNADGHPDLVVGARFTSNNKPESGSARVFSGKDGSILFTSNGDSVFSRLGRSVSGAGDVNADGYADFIAGPGYITAPSRPLKKG